MTPELDAWQARLKESGFRITAERRQVVEAIAGDFDHFEPEELLERLRKRGARVSRATVYRTIGCLVDVGLLRKYDLGDRHTQYEPALGQEHHEHMICVVCGEILEFVEQRIEALQDEVCRKHGFRPLSHTLHIHGICRSCDRRGKSRAALPQVWRPRSTKG